nr:TPA_asm: hypothetical protein HUJ06_002925 [Nelumbo nucifera]
MARIFGRNESEANTNRVVGTYGYMAPEYAMEGIFSVKSDVYSFGVLLLEIVSSKKNTASYLSDRPLNLVGYAWELWKEDAALKLIDPTLDPSCCRNEFLRCIHVGLLCVQESPGDRPTMSVVVSMLTNQMMPLPEPNQPGFSDRSLAPVDSHSRNLEGVSINHATITVMEGR